MRHHRIFSFPALWLCLFLTGASACGQVVINEFMASNRTTTSDEDGGFSDWIELKNDGPHEVDLAGYGLTDDPREPFQWTFPPRMMAPGDLLVVWASGKDRKGLVPQSGLLREVYSIPDISTATTESSGSFPGFPDAVEVLDGGFASPGNVAVRVGQRISGFLSPPVTGEYEFWIAARDNSRLLMSQDDDPAAARTIAVVPQNRNAEPESFEDHPAQKSAPVRLESGRLYYMAAIMNRNPGNGHLAVRWRRDGDPLTTEIIPASRFIIKPSSLHTNFKISASGEPLQLTRPDGVVEDVLPAVVSPADFSFGRPAATPDKTAYFERPTRGGENIQPGFDAALQDVPVFSQHGAFLDDGFSLSLENPAPGTSIIYTLDGSEPNPEHIGGKTYRYKESYPNGGFHEGLVESHLYVEPIVVRDRSAEPNNVSQRTSTYWPGVRYLPTAPVFKGTVVRARLVKDGSLPGPVATHSYFISPGAASRYDLPVISLSMNEDDLFDYSRGLYTPGEDFDTWLGYSGAGGDPNSPANYRRQGARGERPAHFELFDPDNGRVHSQAVGFRIHGAFSRSWPQKSLRLYAGVHHDGNDVLNHPLIPGLVARGTGEPLHTFHNFILRNSGVDHELTRMRDAFIQTLAMPLDLDLQGYEPAVHFINGEYWGIINIRERIDRHFIAAHHNVDPERVAIITNNGEISEGTAADRSDFIAMREYIAANDMADPVHFNYVSELMDVDNFIRYNVAQIYSNNRDWPHNNVDAWRVSPAEGVAAVGGGDGRWRWILFDMEAGFNYNSSPAIDTIAHATRLAGYRDWSTVKLRSLLANEGFRNAFINTCAGHMATTYAPLRVTQLAERLGARISGHFDEHGERWLSFQNHNHSIAPLKAFGEVRPGFMRGHLMSHFGLSGTADLTLDTPDPLRGRLAINGIIIDGGTPGMADPSRPFPWTGEYYHGVPVKVAALPRPGYRFSGWAELPDETSAEVVLMPEDAAKLTAWFEVAPESHLIHYWSFNNTDDLQSPTLSMLTGAVLEWTPGALSEISAGSGQEFVGENARDEDGAGSHLRVNQPLGAIMDLSMPTIGYDNIVLQYETRRSAQGAGIQLIEYSTDGVGFSEFQSISISEAAVVQRFDFSVIPGSADNPLFRVRITFAQGGGGTGGNHRFDNITLEGARIPGTIEPPRFASGPDRLAAVEGAAGTVIDLAGWLEDPVDDGVSFSVSLASDEFATASIEGSLLTLRGLRRGETIVTVTASDGQAISRPKVIVLLVYPAAHVMAAGDYAFDHWSPAMPEFVYPEHLLFLQSEMNDPGIADLLGRAYSVGTDHHEDDVAGFPYNNLRRTRINGLGDAGVSFINTGRGRDLGGALLALDTRGGGDVWIGFTAETIAANERNYALRLQYRLGLEGDFTDIFHQGLPVVYSGETVGGPARHFHRVPLPDVALNQPYVQLLWRCHHVAGGSGPRAEIRLDDIVVSTAAPRASYALWRQAQFPDPSDQAEPLISGPAADPDHRGVANLLRYALDFSPGDESAARMPVFLRDDATGALRLRIPFDREKSDVYFQVAASTDLQSWGEIVFDSRLGVAETKDGYLFLDGLDTRPGAAGGGFFRLVVSLQDEGR